MFPPIKYFKMVEKPIQGTFLGTSFVYNFCVGT